MALIKIASWNIHKWKGLDGQANHDRVAEVLRHIDADIIGLQEVDCRHQGANGEFDLDHLAATLGMTATAGPTRYCFGGFYGNALLTRHAVMHMAQMDLSVQGHEPRGVMDVRVRIGMQDLQVIVTHFGLGLAERLSQARQLLKLVGTGRAPMVVLGDFNEWRPRARTLTYLNTALGRTPELRTFPSRFPLLSLDRIWVSPVDMLVELQAERTRSTRVASDHLPVHALIDLDRGAASGMLRADLA